MKLGKMKNGMKGALIFSVALLCSRGACAAIALLSPGNDETVVLLPDVQREVMAQGSYRERLEWCRGHSRAEGWRKSNPLVLKWRTTEGEKGPWRILVGMRANLSDARVWYLASGKADETTGRVSGVRDHGDGTFSCEVPRANLEVGRTYYWRVDYRGRCDAWDCGPNCSCSDSKRVTQSSVGRFMTDAQPPRWIALEGRVSNVRDLGGWRTEDGRRVRQGMAFRGQGLNDNSVNGEVKGPNRLTVEDVGYLTDQLGIKTDLDLRAKYETADLTESPLGPSVRFILRSSMCYRTIFDEDGKRVMAENFRLFCRKENYPIYFHCIGGADRTGSLAYVLNGVLGVSRHDLETDWEETFYPRLPELRPGYSGDNHWRRLQHLTDGFMKYGDAQSPWRRRIELYLLDCGITTEEIRRFCDIMTER